MHQRQAVEFLRRRYAAAILSDDADTACRLRAQLDAMMNPCADRFGQALPPDMPRPEPVEPEQLEREGPAIDRQRSRRFEPRLIVTAPVTGLLEARPLLSRRMNPVVAAAGQHARG